MPAWLVHLLAVARKELLQTTRDRRMMFLLVAMPIIQVGIFGAAVDFDVDRVPTVVVDYDRTPASRRELEGLFAGHTLRRVASTTDERAAEAMLDRADAAVIVVVARGFARHLARGEPADVQVVVDGSDPMRGNVAGAAVAGYFRSRAPALTTLRVPVPRVALLARSLYNPRLVTSIYMVPGVGAMLLFMVTVIVMSMGLAREREMGTLEQILVTPISPGTLLLGKLLPFVAIGLIDFIGAMAAGAWLFDMPVRASPLVLALATLAYLMTTLGIGLFVSSAARTQQQAFIGGFLCVLPAILLSGTLTPVASMPLWLQPLTYVNPLRWYVETLRLSLLTGAGLDVVGGRIAILAGMGIVVLTTASLRFRRRLA